MLQDLRVEGPVGMYVSGRFVKACSGCRHFKDDRADAPRYCALYQARIYFQATCDLPVRVDEPVTHIF